ncbi:hypothetical protein WN943_013587 [Citrus x changshan-huyou]
MSKEWLLCQAPAKEQNLRAPKTMSNLPEQTLEEQTPPVTNQNPNENNSNNNEQKEVQVQRDQSQEWETMARAWVSAFPEAKAVSSSQVDAWIDSNYSSLPADLQSMPRSELIDRLLSIQHYMKLPNEQKEGTSVETPARFQRTDQWIPVYAWLENLDQDEVVKSKDISDWLNANPQVKEQLCSRHSRYHLMHYIKKCHLKILKRREKKGFKQISNEAAAAPLNKETSLTVQKNVVPKQPAPPPPSNPLSLIPKDSDLYVSKRNEALRKYEILSITEDSCLLDISNTYALVGIGAFASRSAKEVEDDNLPTIMTIKTAPLAETSTLKLEKDILFFFLDIKSAKGLPEHEIGRYTKDILRGLDHIHSRGLVHCDIQADNTLLVAGKDAVSWLRLQILDWQRICSMMTAEISAWGSFGSGLASRDDLLELIAFSSEVPEFPSNISEDGRDFLSKCFIGVHQLRWTAKHVLAHPFPSVDE